VKWLLPIVVAASLSGCSRPAGVAKPTAAPASADVSTFVGTVTGVDPGNTDHPYLKWVVTLTIDEVLSGPPPGLSFWFAIHSPSQEGVKVGQRYRIAAKKNVDGFDVISHDRAD
jgi:hypothetical protein